MLSGKFVLRIDPKMHLLLKKEADRSGESLNAVCVRKLTEQKNLPRMEGLIEKIQKSFSPIGVILFGSVARGEETKSSDVDLLIVLPDDIGLQRELYRTWDQAISISDKYSPQFSHLPKPQQKVGSLWLEASIDGEILLDSENILRKTLATIRGQIAEGRYQRKQSHGHCYWITRDSTDAK